MKPKNSKTKTKRYNLSIVIPAYREEKKIKKCIEESLFYFRNNKRIGNFEIIFVADKTGDKTISIIEQYKKKHPEIRLIVNKRREQKGGSVRVGMLSAKYDLILFYDVDLSTPLYETDNFLKHIDNYDILIASRGLKDSRVEKKFFKIVMSRCFSLLKFVILGITCSDTQCGFKMFHRKCLVILKKQIIKTSTFDVETLFLAKKMGFKVHEMPVTWVDSDVSNFNTFKIIFQVLKDILKIRLHKYDLE